MCSKCGMPQDICVCQDIARERQKIKITSERRRYGKVTTMVEGFDENINVVDLAKKLKQKLACGGTSKGRRIELQGKQKDRVYKALIGMGYNENQIDIC